MHNSHEKANLHKTKPIENLTKKKAFQMKINNYILDFGAKSV